MAQNPIRGLVQRNPTEAWELSDIELDEPGPGEVRVAIKAAGLCHSDHLLLGGGYSGMSRPVVPGHEGAGIVEAVGPGVTSLEPGDHVLLLVPVPACGVCHACISGMTYFCEDGQYTGGGRQITDHTARHHAKGQDLGIFVFLGTFAEASIVNERSCLKLDPSIAFKDACTIGCAGVTGWGAVQNTGRLETGDSVVVVGVGGVGANAIMSARFGGAKDVVAIDPLASKREAALSFGADHAFATFDEARDYLRDVTWGKMANLAVMTMGEGNGQLLDEALSLTGKRGRCVIVNVHPDNEHDAKLSLRALQSSEKQILGCLSGSWHGREGASFLLDLYRRGLYDPSKIVTKTFTLDEIDKGYATQSAGECVRAVVVVD